MFKFKSVRSLLFSVLTKNCGNKKKELTLVTLQSTSFLGSKGPKVPLLLKKMNGFNAMITGLPDLDDFGTKCIPFKNKNCIFPCKPEKTKKRFEQNFYF